MEADIKILEDKIGKLILLCTTLREENQQLRLDLSQANENSHILQNNMQKASSKLQGLLESIPNHKEAL